MTTIQRKTAVVSIALIFTLLFFNTQTGINLLLFEVGALLLLRREIMQLAGQKFTRLILILWSLTAITSFVVHSAFAIFIHIMMSLLLFGLLNYTQAKNIITPLAAGFSNLFHAPKLWVNEKKNLSQKRKLPSLIIFIIPTVIIVAFLIIYSFANKIFGDLVATVITNTILNIARIVEHMNIELVFTVITGIVTGSMLIYRHRNETLANLDNKEEILRRKRRKRNFNIFHPKGLQHEYIAGVFLLFSLNVMISILNVIDITQVWFGFQWKGEDFASMVHEGTALLILAVVASMAVVLYFFRRNQNFYGKQLLRSLALIWIIQNAVLAVSVMMRNLHYVNLFSLSHKRIGVFIFLLVVFIGLITVWIKIRSKKTGWYLFRINSLQVVIILCVFTTFHWDKLIARFNFSRGSESFVYLSHMAALSDAALPYLDKQLEELELMSNEQFNNFNFREHGITPAEYVLVIAQRKEAFLEDYKKQDIRSWNVQDYLTYRHLIQHE